MAFEGTRDGFDRRLLFGNEPSADVPILSFGSVEPVISIVEFRIDAI